MVRSLILSSPKLETIQIDSMGKWETRLWYTHTMEYYSLIEETKL